MTGTRVEFHHQTDKSPLLDIYSYMEGSDSATEGLPLTGLSHESSSRLAVNPKAFTSTPLINAIHSAGVTKSQPQGDNNGGVQNGTVAGGSAASALLNSALSGCRHPTKHVYKMAATKGSSSSSTSTTPTSAEPPSVVSPSGTLSTSPAGSTTQLTPTSGVSSTLTAAIPVTARGGGGTGTSGGPSTLTATLSPSSGSAPSPRRATSLDRPAPCGAASGGPPTHFRLHSDSVPSLHHISTIHSVTSPASVSDRPNPLSPGTQSEGGGCLTRNCRAFKRKLTSEGARKLACGLLVTATLAIAWCGATHFIKHTYHHLKKDAPNGTAPSHHPITSTELPLHSNYNKTHRYYRANAVYYAPFFTTWFCTLWTGLFFPIFVFCRLLICRGEKTDLKSMIREIIQGFQERGFTVPKFFWRVALFCCLWVFTNYLYIHSLRILDATDVMALYSSNICLVYLLSWVILHQQFVGIRIVAVIMCNTGIALLAYMDGLTKSPTLGGVIVGATASAGSAVYKVLFKKLVGDANFGQVAFFFTFISLFNTVLLWPISVALYFLHVEVLQMPYIPWIDLTAAAGLSLITNLLGNFGIAVTYEIFITLGLLVAVPISAAADIYLYHVQFVGMKLSGVLLICAGFTLVLLPNNWPDYLSWLLRLGRIWGRRRQNRETGSSRTSRLRSASGHVK